VIDAKSIIFNLMVLPKLAKNTGAIYHASWQLFQLSSQVFVDTHDQSDRFNSRFKRSEKTKESDIFDRIFLFDMSLSHRMLTTTDGGIRSTS